MSMAHHGVDQDEYRRLSDLLAVGLAVVSTRQGPHDLLVTVEVKVPKDLDPSATSALRAYAQAEKDSGFDPRAGWAGL